MRTGIPGSLLAGLLAGLIALGSDLSFAGSETTQNELASHPSAYLALHGKDPVHWQDWSEELLHQASVQGKLIYISSGYFSCHWCHVMHQESYQNRSIAALLNDAFIPVKVDRELHPALDEYLIEFVRATNGSAGWPLNVFLTPEGYPLAGMTYQPPETFSNTLKRVIELWNANSGDLSLQARLAAMSALLGSSSPDNDPIEAQRMVERFYEQLLEAADRLQGGIGDGSRFPMVPQYLALLELLPRYPNAELREWLELTLDSMSRLGMRDHVNGGFFRYTVDPDQRTPHFEKMLYDQALLARLYLKAGAAWSKPDFTRVGIDTLQFVLDDLQHENGGYIASLSAVDGQNREGAAYLWTADELASSLAEEERAHVENYWSLKGSTGFDHGWLPLRLTTEAPPPGFEKARSKLRQAAKSQAHPRDEKRIASWNGLLLSALVEAARVTPEDQQADWKKTAMQLRNFIVSELMVDDEVVRAIGIKGAFGSAAIEDYAFVARGLLDWVELADASQDKVLASRLVATAFRLFYRQSGWHDGKDARLPGMSGQDLIAEGPLPSPSAVLIELALKLGDEKLRSVARSAIQPSWNPTYGQAIWYPTQTRLLVRQQ